MNLLQLDLLLDIFFGFAFLSQGAEQLRVPKTKTNLNDVSLLLKATLRI